MNCFFPHIYLDRYLLSFVRFLCIYRSRIMMTMWKAPPKIIIIPFSVIHGKTQDLYLSDSFLYSFHCWCGVYDICNSHPILLHIITIDIVVSYSIKSVNTIISILQVLTHIFSHLFNNVITLHLCLNIMGEHRLLRSTSTEFI